MSDQLTVEEARKQLEQMFGQERDYEIRLRNWGYPYLVNVATKAGLRMDFKGDTMSEAMDQVRAWHKEQSK